jgi:hypothetical protein
VQGVDGIPVDAELELVHGEVADPDRARALVPLEVVELVLREPSMAYMIWRSLGLPPIARSSHSRQAQASSTKPVEIKALSVSVESRSQQKR